MTFLYIVFKTETYAICYLYLTTISASLNESGIFLGNIQNKYAKPNMFLRLDCPNWKGIYRDSDDLSLYWLRRHHFVEVHEFIPKID